jgi:hypothetical protein
MKFEYVLMGKFQTDKLNRFGLYRRMSGCNYNVSEAQVLESEKKQNHEHIKIKFC